MSERVLETVHQYETKDKERRLKEAEEPRFARVKTILMNEAYIGKTSHTFSPSVSTPWHMKDNMARLVSDPELTEPLKKRLEENGFTARKTPSFGCSHRNVSFCPCDWTASVTEEAKALHAKRKAAGEPAVSAGAIAAAVVATEPPVKEDVKVIVTDSALRPDLPTVERTGPRKKSKKSKDKK